MFPPGGPDDPLSEAVIATKFDSLATPVLGIEAASELRAAIAALELEPNVERIVRLLQPRV